MPIRSKPASVSVVIGHDLLNGLPKRWLMMPVPEMAKLMDDDVIEHLYGRQNKAPVEVDNIGRRAASP